VTDFDSQQSSDLSDAQGAEHGVNAAARGLMVAERLIQANRPQEAEKELRRALAQRPGDADLHLTLSRAFMAQERVPEAEEAAREAIACEPGHDGAHLILGIALRIQGRNSEAETHILEALRIAPEHAYGHLVYARLMYRTGHIEKAERLARECLRLNPDEADAHQLLTYIEVERKRQAAAQHESRQSARLAPQDTGSIFAMAVAASGGGHPFRARKLFREALAMNPVNKDLEEAYLVADQQCRWIGLPLYFFSLLLARVPGGSIGLWVLFMGTMYGARALGYGEHPALIAFIIFYVGFCLYTWVAEPLSRAWTKVVPPK
jgi:tetratricopeptide (TPR) repeat protein